MFFYREIKCNKKKTSALVSKFKKLKFWSSKKGLLLFGNTFFYVSTKVIIYDKRVRDPAASKPKEGMKLFIL